MRLELDDASKSKGDCRTRNTSITKLHMCRGLYYQWRSCNTVAYINANANESCVYFTLIIYNDMTHQYTLQHRAVLIWQIVRPSVCPPALTLRYRGYRLENRKINSLLVNLRHSTRPYLQIQYHGVQREHSEILAGIGVRWIARDILLLFIYSFSFTSAFYAVNVK